MSATHDARASMFGLFHHARLYDRHANRLLRGLYERVAADVAAAGLGDGTRLLDVGTGPGRVPTLIAATCPEVRVDGLDVSAEMIERARQNATAGGLCGRITFTEGDVAALPYPDDAFDLVVSSLSQHHWPDANAGLREVRRVLRPSGQVWIYDLRIALRRAEAAARRAFPGWVVRREVVRTGWLPLHPIGRLVITPS